MSRFLVSASINLMFIVVLFIISLAAIVEICDVGISVQMGVALPLVVIAIAVTLFEYVK